MNLSRYFTLAELTFSRTAAAERIDNTPADAERSNLGALCTSVLDPLRDAAGAAIKVTSGYRGPVLNARVRGERKSQHLEGKAADIQPTTMSVLELFKTVVRLALPFDQLIYENKSATSKWVHVSHDPATNRGQILLAHFLPTGKVERYEPVTAAQVLEMQEAVSRSARRVDEFDYDEMDDEPSEDEEPEAEPSQARVEDRPANTPAATATPATKKAAAGKKTAGKKAAGRKTAVKKTPAKTSAKTPAKKSSAKKTSAKKNPAKKTTARPGAAKKSSAKKKAPAKKDPAKKASAKKAPAKKAPARKAPARKAAKATKPARRKTAKPAAKTRSSRA